MTMPHPADGRAEARRSNDPARRMIAAALAIFLTTLLLAAASVQGAPLPVAFLTPPQPTVPLLVLRGADGTLVFRPADQTQIRVSAGPLQARIRLMQRFHIAAAAVQDGVYIVPLPDGAAPEAVRLTIGSRHIEAGLRRTRNPQQGDPELLALPIGAIGPDDEVAIDLDYTRPVTISANRVVLSVPALDAGSRLQPAAAPVAVRALTGGAEPALMVEIDPALPISELRSPSHGIDISRGSGERRRVVLSGDERSGGRDLVLVWSPAPSAAALAAMHRHLDRTAATPELQDGVLTLRPRRLGAHVALVPVPTTATPALLGATTLVTTIAAQANGALRPATGPAAPLPIVAVLLAAWAIGALHLVVRSKRLVPAPPSAPHRTHRTHGIADMTPYSRNRIRTACATIAASTLPLLLTLLILAAAASLSAVSARAETGPGQRAGLLFTSPQDGRLIVPSALASEVTIRANGLVQRVTVLQRFRNDTALWLEGVYVFPLPAGSAVDRLRLHIGERVIEGQIKERAAAKAAYQAAAAAGQRASLIEQERPNIFTTSVANVGPGDEIAIEIEYQDRVDFRAGVFSLRFPMVVAPRYVGRDATPAVSVAAGTDADRATVPDADRITPPVLHPEDGPVNPVTLSVTLDPGMPIAAIASASHPIQVADEPHDTKRITLAGAVPADRDFLLEWRPAAAGEVKPALYAETSGNDLYLLGLMAPPAVTTGPAQPRDVIFIVDTSGSMAGTSITQAKAALSAALDRLKPHDRFEIIRFSDDYSRLFGRLAAADDEGLGRARRMVARLQAEGGTEILPALRQALALPVTEGRLFQIVFLTDAEVGNENDVFDRIAGGIGDRRLFTIGIGSAPNDYFMRKAAELGRGTFTYISSTDQVEQRLSELFATLEQPVLTDIKLAWPQGLAAETFPEPVRDLYRGQPVTFIARVPLAQAHGSLEISGLLAGADWHRSLDVDRAQPSVGIEALWGRAKIEAIGDQLYRGADRQSVIAKIVEVALAHHLLSAYTALVAIDPTPARPDAARLVRADVPLNLPAGWHYESVFGDEITTKIIKAEVDEKATALALPQTALGTVGHAVLGLLLLWASGVVLILGGRPRGPRRA